jgi:hypothetical protein
VNPVVPRFGRGFRDLLYYLVEMQILRRIMRHATLLTALILSTGTCWAAEGDEAKPAATPPARTVCQIIDGSAGVHGLPVAFLTRLIWKESRFRPGAVSNKGAQGIAQFMPGTAARRNLADPFDPEAAIAASAHYLHDLVAQFGNLGLAAAAYNAGEDRVAGWLAGSRSLPWETRDYVLYITGYTAEDWMTPESAASAARAGGGADRAGSCAEVASHLSAPGAGAVVAAVPQFRSAAFSPWGVQVAGDFSAARAMATFASLQKKFPAQLGNRDPLILRSVLRSRGRAPFTQIRIPADTREDADRLCGRLREAGGACVVLRNARS